LTAPKIPEKLQALIVAESALSPEDLALLLDPKWPLTLPPGQHSEIGASSADRWMACGGSRGLIAKLAAAGRIKHKSSQAASHGTVAHWVGATCLRNNLDAWNFADRVISTEGWTFRVDVEMVEGVQVYLDYVSYLQKKYPNGKLSVERRLSSVLDDESWGTGDVVFEVPGDRIIVPDLKFGIGVVVEPSKPQTNIYGYQAYEMRGDDMKGAGEPQMIECVIVQPRIPHPLGVIRRYEITPTELSDWFVSKVIPAMARTRLPDQLLVIGDHCRFCPASEANGCPALQREIKTFPTDIHPETMTSLEVGQLLIRLEAIEAAGEKLKRHGLAMAEAGDSPDGWKLVNMKANRVFKTTMSVDSGIADENNQPILTVVTVEEDAKREFGGDAYMPPKMKSPAQMEKIKGKGGKAFVSRWAFTPQAGHTLAKADDKRSAVRPLMDLVIEAGIGGAVAEDDVQETDC